MVKTIRGRLRSDKREEAEIIINIFTGRNTRAMREMIEDSEIFDVGEKALMEKFLVANRFNRNMLYCFHGHNFHSFGRSDINQIQKGEMDDRNRCIESYWKGCYRGFSKTFVGIVDAMEMALADIEEPVTNMIKVFHWLRNHNTPMVDYEPETELYYPFYREMMVEDLTTKLLQKISRSDVQRRNQISGISKMNTLLPRLPELRGHMVDCGDVMETTDTSNRELLGEIFM